VPNTAHKLFCFLAEKKALPKVAKTGDELDIEMQKRKEVSLLLCSMK